jgi:hypothetical protein
MREERKVMNKVLLAIMAGLILIGLLAGCAQEIPEPEKPEQGKTIFDKD